MIAIEVRNNYKDFNCDNCKNSHHCTENDNDESWPKSVGAAPFEILEVEGVIDSKVCLKPMITPFSYKMIGLYLHYDKGILWKAGGVSDQPAVYLQAMELTSSRLQK